MECIYYPELDASTKETTIEGDEFRHIKALRPKTGERVMLLNGKGISGAAIVKEYSKKNCILQIVDIHKNTGELDYKLGLAIGILDNKDRFEFALEKGIELGITEFYPIMTEYCQKRKVNQGRLRSKAIAAMKQCQRSILTEIKDTVDLKKISVYLSNYDHIIVADINGNNINDLKLSGNILLLIGPEGGFSSEELKIISDMDNSAKLKLADRRLRAETAALTALSLITNNITEKINSNR